MARRGENIYKRKDGRWEARLLIQKGSIDIFTVKLIKKQR